MYLESYPKIEGKNFEEIYRIGNDEDGLLTTNDPLIQKHIRKEERHFMTGNVFSWFTLSEEVGYWRKANHIHRWFVENVQDGQDECQPHIVTRKKILELLNLCYDVFKKRKKPENALPTTNGFFFGGTAYDDYYFYQIEHTIEILESVIESFDFKKNYLVYLSSW